MSVPVSTMEKSVCASGVDAKENTMGSVSERMRAIGRRQQRQDGVFHGLTFLFALTVLMVLAGIIVSLIISAIPVFREFGWRFITMVEWDPVNEVYGAAIAIFGTLVTSLIALLIAVPLSFGIALFLTELCPVWLRRSMGTAIELLAGVLGPLLERVGLSPELLPLMLVRPISGSAALGVGAELIHAYGPDSALGRTAAVMLGSTETTFYTIAVYFGAVRVSRTRYAVPAALCADIVGFLASAWAVDLLFGG